MDLKDIGFTVKIEEEVMEKSYTIDVSIYKPNASKFYLTQDVLDCVNRLCEYMSSLKWSPFVIVYLDQLKWTADLAEVEDPRIIIRYKNGEIDMKDKNGEIDTKDIPYNSFLTKINLAFRLTRYENIKIS